MTEYLAKKGARVYMICRNAERAEKAKEEICVNISLSEAEKDRLRILIADVSLSEDVTQAIQQLKAQESKLDCLVCNAGALVSSKKMTKDNLEITFASHLAVGTYLLSRLAMPLLEKSEDPRLVVVTSGGQYTASYPGYETAALAEKGSFNGQLQYAYAKRGQVYLVQKWSTMYPKLKVVSAHPGWTSTPGVDSAYGSLEQKLLSPLRSLWEGTEGIAWLCVGPRDNIEDGMLYLDRFVQPFDLTSRTKNTDAEKEELFQSLAKCTNLPFAPEN